MLIHDLATAWVRANCRTPKLQSDFEQQLQVAVKQQVSCSFAIGRKLTKSGKPMLVCCYCGELFAFALTPRQAQLLKLGDEHVVTAHGGFRQNHDRRPEPSVWIDEIFLDQDAGLKMPPQLSGTFQYSTDEFWNKPVVLQIVMEPPSLPKKLFCQHFNALLPPEGELKFSVVPSSKSVAKEAKPFTGVLPLFFQLCVEEERGPNKQGVMLGDAHKTTEQQGFFNPAPIMFPQPHQPGDSRYQLISDIRAVLVEFA